DHWNPEAENFGGMFTEATRKAGTLLDSGKGNLPRRFVDKLARADHLATREMFRALYDESVDLFVRITAFLEISQKLWKKYYSEDKEYKLYPNSASTFLWLRYPDKYIFTDRREAWLPKRS
ncbi:MAG: restriction endonuclease, partial [Lentisphaeria bacterium]|nr:restriction endonuclease [Lentisphaeria bacterium]